MIIFIGQEVLNSTGGGVISQRNLSFLKKFAEHENLPFEDFYQKSPISLLDRIFQTFFYLSPATIYSIVQLVHNSNGKTYIWWDRSIFGVSSLVLIFFFKKEKLVIMTYYHNQEIEYMKAVKEDQLSLLSQIKWQFQFFILTINYQLNQYLSDHNFFINPVEMQESSGQNKFLLTYSASVVSEVEKYDDQEMEKIINHQPYVLFVGSFFKPNVEGLTWFIDH
jgi:hypothetical protein